MKCWQFFFCASNEESAVLARAFDEYRVSLGTCFQDVCKGGDAVGLITQILG